MENWLSYGSFTLSIKLSCIFMSSFFIRKKNSFFINLGYSHFLIDWLIDFTVGTYFPKKVKIYNITDNMWLSHVTIKSHDLSK